TRKPATEGCVYSFSNPMKTLLRCACFVLLQLFCIAALCAAKSPAKSKYLLYVGTYTEKTSKGIYVYGYNPASGRLTEMGLAAETANPSFLAVDGNSRFLYAVNEVQKYKDQSSGGVSAFSIDAASGKISLLNEVASGGADPCYVSIDKTGKYVLV